MSHLKGSVRKLHSVLRPRSEDGNGRELWWWIRERSLIGRLLRVLGRHGGWTMSILGASERRSVKRTRRA